MHNYLVYARLVSTTLWYERYPARIRTDTLLYVLHTDTCRVCVQCKRLYPTIFGNVFLIIILHTLTRRLCIIMLAADLLLICCTLCAYLLQWQRTCLHVQSDGLMAASEGGHLDVVSFLVDQGANMNAKMKVKQMRGYDLITSPIFKWLCEIHLRRSDW